MRHNKKFNHLGRQSSHRKALLSNMSTSLIMHKRINTTVAKAKALKIYVEPIITKAKEDSTHSRRIAFSYLKDKHAVTELFRVVAPAVGDRPGGYTRILRTGFRLGDAADMCFIELVDFNETYGKEIAATTKGRTRRGRRPGAKNEGEEQIAADSQAQTEEGESTSKADKKPAKSQAVKSKPAVQKNALTKTSVTKTSGAKTVAKKTAASKKS